MRKLKIVILSFIVSMLFVISNSQIALSVVNYNENIYGDFPNWFTQNSSNIMVLNVGTNTILGTTKYYYSGTSDNDAIRFTIPEGMSLSIIDISLTNSGTGTVNNYVLSLYSFDSSFDYSQISTWESGSPPVSKSAFSDVLPLLPGNYAILDTGFFPGSFSEGQDAVLHYAIEITVTGTSLPDTDEDGILDSFDNCLNIVNFEQTNSDTDGLGDACDACPLDPANDIDGDGICGNLDNFPDVPIIPGDINNDGNIDLTDTLLATQVMTNIESQVPVFKEADINNNGEIGFEEAIHALQVTSGLKPQP